ncbi:MAG: hypothetical protein L0Y55_01235 [Anaerolineales bacterium]|nr:hypothetical protein [Anaerolineales bacterium]
MASSDFWSSIGTTNADIERAYAFLLERGDAASSREIAAHLIEWRVREEEKHLAEAAARRAPVYQPKETYAVDQHLIFSELEHREGVVTQVRASDNPRLEPFQVIAVQLEGESAPREFAMQYTAPHPLNQDRGGLTELTLKPEEAIAKYGETVRTVLLQRLGADKEFVRLDDGWFLRGLLPEIHEGYLNLAEAAIEQSNDALRTADLLKIFEFPATIKKTAAAFALNVALAHDARFEDVGPSNNPRWFLTRLEPIEARERPKILEAAPARKFTLQSELETIAAELHDEADLNGDANNAPATPRDEITLILTYPHRRAGTLPLTPAVRALLPSFDHARLRINFVDATSQEKIAGYAVKDGYYIAGLTNWFNARKLSPGAYLTLKRGSDPLTVLIDYQAQRERGLWVRVARGVNGQLTFSQEKRPIAHKSDEEMLIVIGDPVGLEAAAQKAREHHSLATLLEEIFPELAKLSGAGRVHAKTLYSAVNLIRRAGPRAVLHALAESTAFSSVGGGYFVLNETRR